MVGKLGTKGMYILATQNIITRVLLRTVICYSFVNLPLLCEKHGAIPSATYVVSFKAGW